MGDTVELYCVRVRPRGPGHADVYQPLGDVNAQGATFLGKKVNHGFETNPPQGLARPASANAQPDLPLLGGAI